MPSSISSRLFMPSRFPGLSIPSGLGNMGNHRMFKPLAIGIYLSVSLILWMFNSMHISPAPRLAQGRNGDPPAAPTNLDSLTTDIAQYFADYPLTPPYKDLFGELGRRARILRDSITLSDQLDATATEPLHVTVEQTAALLFPFLANPPKNPTSSTPLADLRSTYEPGSAGIVIPASDKTLRFAGHLVVSIRSILGSRLPIQITHAGDDDLSRKSRTRLSSLVEAGPALEFLDITTVFDDSTLHLGSGGWAIKPFAALGSRFERVILLDADAVLFQKPEVLLRHGALGRAGALLFHDRLLWQHAYAERHEWWKEQIRRPSGTLNQSLVWTEEYAEEGDSGLVVLDKSRVDVVMGLLHVCWQNSYAVREEVTYKLTYGDKESWWLGFELAGTEYEFEKHYAGIVGWEKRGGGEEGEDGKRDGGESKKVCSFVIAHVDEEDKLLWYNGGLMKNKGREELAHVYEVPNKWMIDGNWIKGANRKEMSCMDGGDMKDLKPTELGILEESMRRAKEIDSLLE